jgi:hypothetical protein
VDRVRDSALHSGRCAACCEAHTNFADESEYLTADNVRSVENAAPLHVDIFQVQQSFLHLQHTGHQLSLDDFSNCAAVLAQDFDTPVS